MLATRLCTLAALAALTCCDGGAAVDTTYSVAGYGGPTLLVQNTTCGLDGCTAFNVRAFVPKFTVPGQLPTGMMYIGRVTGYATCLRFPAADTLLGIRVDTNNIPVDTIRTIWTPGNDLGVLADTGGFLPFGQDVDITPGDAAGWSIQLPATDHTAAVPASPCM